MSEAKFILIADLVDPNGLKGRTYREINNDIKHKFEVGDLVEIDGTVRLFIVGKTRDCDGTPLYNLDTDPGGGKRPGLCGYSEDGMEKIVLTNLLSTKFN